MTASGSALKVRILSSELIPGAGEVAQVSCSYRVLFLSEETCDDICTSCNKHNSGTENHNRHSDSKRGRTEGPSSSLFHCHSEIQMCICTWNTKQCLDYDVVVPSGNGSLSLLALPSGLLARPTECFFLFHKKWLVFADK